MLTEQRYQTVREGGVRQRKCFVKEVDFGEVGVYVWKVSYKHLTKADDSGNPINMETGRQGSGIFQSFNRRSIIKVYSAAFDYCSTIGDFLNMLIDHEGYHAKENCEPERTWFLSPIEREIQARRNQIRNFDVRQCSQEFRQLILQELRTSEEARP